MSTTSTPTTATPAVPRHRRVLDTAIGAIKQELIALINTATEEWGKSEGLVAKELTPQAIRDDRMGRLVHTISKEVGSSVGQDALCSLVDAIVGRRIPRIGGPFGTMPIGGAIMSSGRMFIISVAGSASASAALIQVDNASSNSMSPSSKETVTLPSPEEVRTAIEAAPPSAVLALYDAFAKAAADAAAKAAVDAATKPATA